MGGREYPAPTDSSSPTYRQNTLPGACAGRPRLNWPTEDVLVRSPIRKCGAHADAPSSTCGGWAMRRAKMAAPCGTAKFREETSKKADSATRGRIAALHNVGG
jgi:hypothetical protein